MSSKSRSPWRGFIFMPILAVLMAVATYYLIPPEPPDPGLKPAGEGELNPIGIPQAAGYFNTGLVFVDTRTKEAFDQAHIPKARLFTAPEKLAGLAVVVYGQGDDMDLVLEKAQSISAAGAAPVYVLLEGFNGWLEAGLSVTKGDK